MLGAIGIVAAGAVIVLIEFPFLRKSGKKEIWAFSVSLIVALALGIAKAVRVPIPNPLDWIAYVFKPVSEMVFKWLA
jgi:hypothetical protein